MTAESNIEDIPVGPGMVELDAAELAVRFLEVLTESSRPNNASPEAILYAIGKKNPELADTVTRLSNVCVDYFGEMVRGYARQV